MLLSCRMLANVSNVNAFEYATPMEFSEGDTPVIYLQLIDLSQDRAIEGYSPAGRRYAPASGATLQVTFDSVDSAKKIVRAATQPFPLDPSIWSVQVLPTDVIKGTVTLRLQLTEGLRTMKGHLKAALSVLS